MTSGSVSVTGATGFIGWHLAESFRHAGWHVRAIVRPGNVKPLPPGVEIVEAALEAASLKHAVTGSSVVVHAAAVVQASRQQTFDAVNVAGTQAAVEAANAVGARLIFISSQAAAGEGSPVRPSRECDMPRPIDAYGRSKLAAEAVVRSTTSVPWTIVRPCAVYGPRDRAFLPLFRLASRGLFLLAANPNAAYSLIYVEDLARSIVGMAGSERASGETLFLAHPRPQTAEDILQALALVFDRPYKPRRVPVPMLRAVAYLGEIAATMGFTPWVDTARVRTLATDGFVCSVDRAREVLDFTAAVEWPEGARRTARWYVDRGWM